MVLPLCDGMPDQRTHRTERLTSNEDIEDEEILDLYRHLAINCMQISDEECVVTKSENDTNSSMIKPMKE